MVSRELQLLFDGIRTALDAIRGTTRDNEAMRHDLSVRPILANALAGQRHFWGC